MHVRKYLLLVNVTGFGTSVTHCKGLAPKYVKYKYNNYVYNYGNLHNYFKACKNDGTKQKIDLIPQKLL